MLQKEKNLKTVKRAAQEPDDVEKEAVNDHPGPISPEDAEKFWPFHTGPPTDEEIEAKRREDEDKQKEQEAADTADLTMNPPCRNPPCGSGVNADMLQKTAESDPDDDEEAAAEALADHPGPISPEDADKFWPFHAGPPTDEEVEARLREKEEAEQEKEQEPENTGNYYNEEGPVGSADMVPADAANNNNVMGSEGKEALIQELLSEVEARLRHDLRDEREKGLGLIQKTTGPHDGPHHEPPPVSKSHPGPPLIEEIEAELERQAAKEKKKEPAEAASNHNNEEDAKDNVGEATADVESDQEAEDNAAAPSKKTKLYHKGVVAKKKEKKKDPVDITNHKHH